MSDLQFESQRFDPAQVHMVNTGDLIELLDDVLTYDHDGTTNTLKKGILGIVIAESLSESGGEPIPCDWIQSSVGTFWEIRFNNCTVLCSRQEIRVIK